MFSEMVSSIMRRAVISALLIHSHSSPTQDDDIKNCLVPIMNHKGPGREEISSEAIIVIGQVKV